MFDRALFDKQQFDKQAGSAVGLYAVLGGASSLKIDPYLSARACLPGQDIHAQGGLEAQALCVRVPIGAVEFSVGLALEHTAEAPGARAELLPAAMAMGGSLTSEFIIRASLAAELGAGAEVCVADFLSAMVPAGQTDFNLTAQLDAAAMLRLPIGAVDFAMGAAVSTGHLCVRIPLIELELGGRGMIVPLPIAGLGSEKLALEGVNLAPGQELIIDTDTVEIFINGVEDVTKDTYDSKFFQLLSGDNQLVFRDSESDRVLKVNIVMSARWL